MNDLEKEAKYLLNPSNFDMDRAINLLSSIPFLKQPYQFGFWKQISIRCLLSKDRNKNLIKQCFELFPKIDEIDYGIMGLVGNLPYFGLRGGRSFNSALMRILFPHKFAIIDWRNMAVMANASGFGGLIDPPINFNSFGIPNNDIITKRGQLKLDQPIYNYYNNHIRELGKKYNLMPSDIDLIIWTFSIYKQPFKKSILFNKFINISEQERRIFKVSGKRKYIIGSKINDYITSLKHYNFISKGIKMREVRAIINFIKNECNNYKKILRETNITGRFICEMVKNELDYWIICDKKNLLKKWQDWEDKVNPAAKKVDGAQMPGSMVMSGFLILEDFIDVKNLFT